MKKITIKRRDYRRPKRLFYEGQGKRHIFPYLHKRDEEKLIIEPDTQDTVDESAAIPPVTEAPYNNRRMKLKRYLLRKKK